MFGRATTLSKQQSKEEKIKEEQEELENIRLLS